jgi:hypothetical protein
MDTNLEKYHWRFLTAASNYTDKRNGHLRDGDII